MRPIRDPNGEHRIDENDYERCAGLHPSPKPFATWMVEAYQNPFLLSHTILTCDKCVKRVTRQQKDEYNHSVATECGKIRLKR